MPPPASRNAIFRLMNAAQHTACPCHGCRAAGHAQHAIQQMRKYATPVDVIEKEYAFEVGRIAYPHGHILYWYHSRSLLQTCGLATV